MVQDGSPGLHVFHAGLEEVDFPCRVSVTSPVKWSDGLQDCTYRDHCEARILGFGALELTSPSPTSRTEGLSTLLGSRRWKRLEWDLALDYRVSGAVLHHLIPFSLPGGLVPPAPQRGLCPSPLRPCHSLCTPFAAPAHSLPQLKGEQGPAAGCGRGGGSCSCCLVPMVMGCLDSASPFLFLGLGVRRDQGFIC